jgi:hypothetical protein
VEKIESNKKYEDSTAWARKMNRIKLNIKIIYKGVVYGKVREMKINISLHKCFIFECTLPIIT